MRQSKKAATLTGSLLVVLPTVALLSIIAALSHPTTALAITWGNTDVYESGAAPGSNQSCITSPIWGAISSQCGANPTGYAKVTQRYGCTDEGLEDTVSSQPPATPQFTWPCTNLGPGWNHWHHGIDIGLNSNTAVYSPVSGKIVAYDTTYAALGLQDLSGHVLYFIHGTPVSGIGVGSLIAVGQHFYDSDNLGLSQGAHLHLEVHSSQIGVRHGDPGWWDDINPEAWVQYQGPRAATVSSTSNRIDVFVRGTTGLAYQLYSTDGGTSWTWTLALAAPGSTTFAGQLSALTNAPNQIFLYGIGADGNLYQNYATNNTNWRSSWDNIGNPGVALIGTPAAVTWASQQNLSIFARGTDGALYDRYYSPSGWGPWESRGGYTITDATAISPGSNQLHVFVLGDLSHNGTTYDFWYSGSAWSLINWGTAPSGSGPGFVAQPTAGSHGASAVDAFATSQDGNLWTQHFNGSTWGGWQLAGMPRVGTWVFGAPASTDFLLANWVQVSAFVRGFDAAGYMCWSSGSSCSSPWDALGGAITNDPAAISNAANQLDVFVRGSDFAVYHLKYALGWSWQPSLGGFMA